MRTLFTVLALAASLAACGDDDNKAVDAGTKPPIDAAIDAPPAVTLDCPTYCNAVMTNCAAPNAQYVNMDQCLGSCAAFPVGAAADTSGNTLGCRLYHATNAKTSGNPALHCPHAGPAGDLINAAPPKFCSGGDVCDDFCQVEINTCGSLDAPKTGITAQYQNLAACKTACAGFNKTNLYTLGGTPATPAGDSLACRLYHATNAAGFASKGDVTNTDVHCKHAAATPTGPCAGTAAP